LSFQHQEATRTASSREGATKVALLIVGLRRLRFVARFIYWTYKHGSTKHAGWVCNYEGLYW
jgi:hypothetical protein